MVRHLPRRWAPFALSLIALFAVALPAVAQDRSVEERLDRIERDMNMLQRQVYRGGPPPMAGGDGNAALGMEVRLNRLEDEMRDLTGRVEEYGNKVDQLRARLEQVNNDNQARVAEGGPPPGPANAGRPPPGFPPAPGVRPPADSDFPPPPAGLGGRASAGPEPIFGTLSPPGSPAGVPPGNAALTPPSGTPAPPPPGPSRLASTGADGPRPGGAVPAGSPGEQYNQAFGLLRKADYPAAEAALHAFLDQHPNDPMAGNAQYWLGDTYFARSRYADAARAFAEVYKRYPKSAKAPEALLKLGMSLANANQKQNACVALAQLDQAFPHAAANVKQQAATEKKRLGCS